MFIRSVSIALETLDDVILGFTFNICASTFFRKVLSRFTYEYFSPTRCFGREYPSYPSFCFSPQLGSERRPLLHEAGELNSKIPRDIYANARLPGSNLPPPPPSAPFTPSLQDPSAQRDTARHSEHRNSSPRMYGGRCTSWRIICP